MEDQEQEGDEGWRFVVIVDWDERIKVVGGMYARRVKQNVESEDEDDERSGG